MLNRFGLGNLNHQPSDRIFALLEDAFQSHAILGKLTILLLEGGYLLLHPLPFSIPFAAQTPDYFHVLLLLRLEVPLRGSQFRFQSFDSAFQTLVRDLKYGILHAQALVIGC